MGRGRLLASSDGVFAVIITSLVLEIKVLVELIRRCVFTATAGAMGFRLCTDDGVAYQTIGLQTCT